jgi:hypothetical protein
MILSHNFMSLLIGPSDEALNQLVNWLQVIELMDVGKPLDLLIAFLNLQTGIVNSLAIQPWGSPGAKAIDREIETTQT